MSVGRRIVEGAKTGLNSLVDRVTADETPLTGIEREELDAELARRQKARQGSARSPGDNPRARWAGAGDEAARHRRQAADSRESRIRAARAERKRVEDAAREEAWERLQADARRQAASGAGVSGGARSPSSGARSAGAGPRPGASSGSGRPGGGARSAGGARPGGPRAGSGARPGGAGRAGSGGRQDKIAQYYKVLDLPVGAGFDEVKAAYRKLMRKYHPDLHHQTPQKAKAATELTMQVTQAYNELEAYLIRKG